MYNLVEFTNNVDHQYSFNYKIFVMIVGTLFIYIVNYIFILNKSINGSNQTDLKISLLEKQILELQNFNKNKEYVIDVLENKILELDKSNNNKVILGWNIVVDKNIPYFPNVFDTSGNKKTIYISQIRHLPYLKSKLPLSDIYHGNIEFVDDDSNISVYGRNPNYLYRAERLPFFSFKVKGYGDRVGDMEHAMKNNKTSMERLIIACKKHEINLELDYHNIKDRVLFDTRLQEY
jgi:hypothetical protein